MTPIVTRIIFVISLLIILNEIVEKTKITQIKENSYIDYAKFYGTESVYDKNFIKK